MPILERVDMYDWPNVKSIISLNCLVHLTKLRIEDCESLESFPDNLISLKKLKILNCPSMDASIPSWVWPPNLLKLKVGKLKKPVSEWGPRKFPTSLVKLELYGGGEDGVCSSSHFSHLLPSSLTYLTIHEFEKLESFSTGLQHLTSLQRLQFYKCRNLKKVSSHPQCLTSVQRLTFFECPKMMDLPEMLLPSLLSLYISGNCPEGLKERCSKNGSYWPLIYHIPFIRIM
ncbi:putative leucine-rich repeat domain superfamily [Helianthus anomalus]